MADFVPAFSARGVDPGRAVPGAAIAMSVSSVFLLSLTTNSVMPPVLAIAVLCSTPLLSSSTVLAPLARWLVRPAVMVAVLIKLLVAGFRFDQDWLLHPLLLAGIGFFLSGELAFQATRPRDKGQNSVPSLILLSALILICASFTRDTRFVPYVTPIYFIFLLITLSRFAPEEPVRTGNIVRSARSQIVLLGGLVLAAGLLMHCFLWINRDPITRMFMSFMLRFEQRASTGLPDVPYLRSTTELAQARTRLLRVSGALQDPHLRSTAYDLYTRPGTWRSQLSTRWLGTLALPELNSTAAGPRLRVERINDNTGLIYVPLHAAGVATDEPVQLEYTRDMGSGPLRAVTQGLNRINYTVIQSDETEHQWMFCQPRLDLLDLKKRSDIEYRGSQFEQLSTVPPDVDRRVVELGQKITLGISNPRDKIRAVQNYLAANHHYSLKVDLPPGDPVSMFLLNKEDGFCEYFASGAVMLLRASGVPSRYVQGYYVHDLRSDGSYVVRACDAHAWCESWVAGSGWVTVEATPGGGLPSSTNTPNFQDRVSEWLSETWDTLSTWLLEKGWSAVLYSGLLLLSFLIAYQFLLAAWRGRRRTKRVAEFHYSSPGELLRNFHARYEALLRGRRAACPPNVTWQEHLERLAQQAPDAKLDLEKAREFVRGYNSARFRSAVPFDEFKRLDDLLVRLERN